jgi:hypothetical protein
LWGQKLRRRVGSSKHVSISFAVDSHINNAVLLIDGWRNLTLDLGTLSKRVSAWVSLF